MRDRMMAMGDVEILSALIGYTYTILWTASFYPQAILNVRRKTTRGFSPDFALLNVLGMTSYAAHNCALAFSLVVRQQYAQRHPSSPIPMVQLNDVAYAVHGALITSIIYTQFYPQLWGFTKAKGQKTRPSVVSFCLVWGCIAMIASAILAVLLAPHSQTWMWLDVIYLLGTVKSILTVVKYTPQVWLNYQRKSTRGLSIFQINLDLVGALLSILQLIIDSANAGDWSGLFGNPAKLALGNVTLLFDLAFYFQHIYLYSNANDDMVTHPEVVREEEPLLGASSPSH